MTPAEAVARALGRPRSVEADQAIRLAAVELFGEHGFEGLSVDEVAARAGVSKATIYRRYPSKVDLVVEAASCLADDTAVHVDTGTLQGDLRGYARGMVRKLKGTVGRIMPVMVFETRRYPELAEGYRRFIDERRARMRETLQLAVDRGELPADADIDLMGAMIVGPIFHRLLVSQEPLTDAFADKLADAVMRSFIV
jgi:AcrR family transcriptional regulator